MTVALKLLKWV